MFRIVHNVVKGRVRYKIDELYRCENFGIFLRLKLTEIDNIESFNINVTTGSLLIYYGAAKSLEDLNRLLESLIKDYKTNKPHFKKDSNNRSSGFLEKISAFFTEKKSTSKSENSKILSQIVAKNYQESKWHLMPIEDVLRTFNSIKNFGLSLEVYEENLKKYGTNSLPEPVMRTRLEIFLEQFKSLPVLLLGAASIISIFTGGLIDAVVILTVIMLNASIGCVTEYEVEQTITSLKKIIKPTALVIRNGKISEIEAEKLVPGDIFILKPGSFVPADGRILEAFNLTVDESALTGESMPVSKTQDKIIEDHDDSPVSLAERYNMVFMGTRVTSGQGIAITVATGIFTEIGKIQSLIINQSTPKTHIEEQLDTIGKQLVIASSVICGIVMVIGIIRGYSIIEMIKMSISLAVAAVPEGLPTVATTTLSLGIRKMRKKAILIRHLNAIENLGLIQTLCLDKTGTLTYNKMTVVEIYAGMKSYKVKDFQIYNNSKKKSNELTEYNKLEDVTFIEELNLIMLISLLCSESEIELVNSEYKANGSSTENALIELAFKSGIDIASVISNYNHITTKLRSINVNYMAAVHSYNEDEENKYFLTLKGSPTEILDMCDYYIKDGKVKPLTNRSRKKIELENERMAGAALRILGFAFGIEKKKIEITKETPLSDILEAYSLCWVGLVGLFDPLREGAKELIDKLKTAGINTIIITGDQTPTAYAIASELNLNHKGTINILDSTRLAKMNEEVLSAISDQVDVFARVSPENKLQIVKAIQKKGKVVAMTGDGINDGPALKSSDIGIAMGKSGTDSAREVADIIIEDDNIKTLVEAITYGRATYYNIRKSLRFLLSTNSSEILVMFTGMALGLGQPLNAMQLLWINLITDVAPALALSLEEPEDDIMQRNPPSVQENIVTNSDYKKIIMEASNITLAFFLAYLYGIKRYGLGLRANSLSFLTLSSSQLLHSVTCKSDKHSLFSYQHIKPNKYLKLSLLTSFGLQAGTIFFPPLRNLLKVSPLGIVDLLVVSGCSLLSFFLNEGRKEISGRL